MPDRWRYIPEQHPAACSCAKCVDRRLGESQESVGRPPADPGSLNDNSGVGLPFSLTFITLIIAALALVVFAYPEEGDAGAGTATPASTPAEAAPSSSPTTASTAAPSSATASVPRAAPSPATTFAPTAALPLATASASTAAPSPTTASVPTPALSLTAAPTPPSTPSPNLIHEVAAEVVLVAEIADIAVAEVGVAEVAAKIAEVAAEVAEVAARVAEVAAEVALVVDIAGVVADVAAEVADIAVAEVGVAEVAEDAIEVAEDAADIAAVVDVAAGVSEVADIAGEVVEIAAKVAEVAADVAVVAAEVALVVEQQELLPPHPPYMRHVEEKLYMLELINAERIKAGLAPVVLGDNDAAQLHAEAALEGCFWSHWGIDGLKPYMRYSLAGGYQSNAENIIGLNHCIKWHERYAAIVSIEQEIREAMAGWLDSPGHLRNLLDRWHKKVNIGLAWDRYNILTVQHFEGDYVEYDRLPALEDGLLVLSGGLKNGVRLEESSDLGVQIYYDRPPHALTRGQVARTYCYGSGRLIASLRRPLGANWFWPEDEFTTTQQSCPDPYHVPADAPAPRSYDEALEFWQAAYDASQALEEESITVPWIDASKWDVGDDAFSVTADLSELLREYGAGVYSLIVWGGIGGEKVIVSEYSIFHGVSPPDGYTGGAPGPP